jgi:glycosyltransferase involved in cell wall biosynthesis
MRILSYAILAYWILAFARTIVNVLLATRLVPRMPRRTPRVSVIVPARDEERRIDETVRALFAQTYPDLEILVVNDRSTDATGALLEKLAREDARLKVIDNDTEPPAGWLGKPWALHQGSLRATGELLLFIDADILYAPDAIAAAVAEMEERDVPMLALLPFFEMHGFWEHVAMPNLGFFTFSLMPLWLANRTRFSILAIGGGTGNLVRRSDYDACGGHEPLRGAIVDDVGLARLFRQHGRRTEVVMADDLVSVRMYHGLGEIVRGFTKNGFAIVGRSYAAVLVILLLTVAVHFVPYGLALVGDPIALVTVGLISLTRLILFLYLRYRIDSALFAHPLMIAVWTYILLRSTWRTGIRREIEWRGRRYDANRTD